MTKPFKYVLESNALWRVADEKIEGAANVNKEITEAMKFNTL